MKALLFGHLIERRAARLLERAGLEVLLRNLRTASGEIDIVAREGRCLVLVEVRYRARHLAEAFRSIDWRKRECLMRAGREARAKLRLPRDLPIRFDVVCATAFGRMAHIRGAFSATR